MYILDSCAVRGILHNTGQYPLLEQRVTFTLYEHLFISIVVLREQMQWMLGVAKGNETKGRFDEAYKFLKKMIEAHMYFQILPFDDEDLKIFKDLPPETRQIKQTDRLIAATAIRHNFTVITMNKRDFERIPHCLWTDWSR